MKIKINKSKTFVTITIICTILAGSILPITLAVNVDRIGGFNKGPSYQSVVPMKKVTFVNYDENSLIDDYAYLAAIPTAVFRDDNRLFSHPLLFYEDEYKYEEDRYRSLNARQGLDYFMEDWMSYCNDQLDQMILINVPEEKIDKSEWDAEEYVTIEGDNPYDIASKIALHGWSYSNDAVIAVIQPSYEKPNELTKGKTTGTLHAYDVGHEDFIMERPTVGIGGNYKPFEITNKNYKYLVIEATWDEPSFDVDMQIYDDQLGMVSSNMASSWKKGEAKEFGGSYIHNYGTWEVGLTAFPKKSISSSEGKMKSMFQNPSTGETGLFSKFIKDIVNVDVMLYPGIDVEIDALPAFGCRDAEFTLKWDDPGVNLGFTVVDLSRTEIASSLTQDQIIKGEFEGNNNKATVEVAMLGECTEDETYSVCVYALDDISRPVDFTIEYCWTQKYSEKEGDCLASASNGAILASALNAPLLYANPSSLPEVTKDALYKLGVDTLHLINIGSYLSNDIKNEIKEIADTINNYDEPKDIYDAIREITQGEDIIFSTIEPWAKWYVSELEPADEEINEGARFIGPAAYIAAHHGSPLLIVDIHPELSQAVVYHKDFWVKNAKGRAEPSAGDMIISGRQVYSFLDEHGFDKKGNNREEAMETIITVAGQFNIGPSWDRTFVGKALSGRFHFSPVDTAYWICRNEFYPAMIFVNPGMENVKLWQGSKSTIPKIGGRLQYPKGVNLVVKPDTRELEFEYPVLQTFVSAAFQFNKQASKHWGTLYTRADGIIPYIQPSPDAIDVGAVPEKTGAYYPDLDDTNVVPFYAGKAGYASVFSTNFEKVAENLNHGVIMWCQDAHGYHHDGGIATFWNPESPYIYEENPWRAYEPIMFKPGHLRTFLHWIFFMLEENTGNEAFGKLADFKPIKFQLFSERGCTANPDVALFNPNLAGINRLVNKLTGGMLEILGAFGFMIHWDRLFDNPDKLPLITTYDGMVTTSGCSGSWIIDRSVNGLEFDDALENLHSVGINTVVCLPAGTYLHMAWVRHGSVYQIMDPWGTSDYCAVWLQSIIKNLALGDTIGQAYEKGIRAVGQELLVDQFWWDTWENVCFYGDPDLRVFVPSTEWDPEDKNHWERDDTKPIPYNEELNIDGHMPFGAIGYPHERKPEFVIPLWIVAIIVIVLLIMVAVAVATRKKIEKR